MKKFLTVFLTIMILLSITFVGVATVYRVDNVTVQAQLLSQDAKDEAEALKTRLQKAYETSSIFFVNNKKANAIIKEYPCFRLTDFIVKYPNLITVCVTEDEEVYATPVPNEAGKYYVFNANGILLGKRDTLINRIPSNGKNVLLTLSKKESNSSNASVYNEACFTYAIQMCKSISQHLGGIRNNVQSVEIRIDSSDDNGVRMVFSMKEGVEIYIQRPMRLTERKAEQAIEKYLSLDVAQRMQGEIWVTDNNEVVRIEYLQ